MSSTNVVKSLHTLVASYSSFLPVDSRQIEKLGDFVQRIRKEKGLSTGEVEKRSGFTITDGYVSRIENGGVKNVSPEKLSALAKGLGVLEEEIFAIARGKAPNEESVTDERFEVISLKYRTLEKEDRRDVEVLLQTLERELERRNNAKN